jgi:hypothetical protein
VVLVGGWAPYGATAGGRRPRRAKTNVVTRNRTARAARMAMRTQPRVEIELDPLEVVTGDGIAVIAMVSVVVAPTFTLTLLK